MATTQNEAGLPQIQLTQGMIVRFSAISPTTGAAVTGVTVSNVSIYGGTLAPSPDALPQEDLLPIYLQQNDPDYAGTAS